MPTVAELDVQVDANDDASATLAAIDALIKSMEGDDVTIQVETDSADAAGELAVIQAAIDAINGRDATVEVDVEGEEAAVAAVLGVEKALERLDGSDATAEVRVTGEREAARTAAAVEARLAAIPDEEVTIEYDTDRGMASLNRLSAAALRASGTVNLLAASILGLGPALVPLAGVALAGVGALGGAFVTAGLAAGLFGAVAVTTFNDVSDANKKLTTLQEQYNQAVTDDQREAALEKMKAVMESLTPAQREMLKGVQDFSAAWQSFAGQFEPLVFEVAAEGLRGMASLLPSLAPMVRGAGEAFLSLEKAAFAALRGPFWQEFIAMMGTQARPTMEGLGRSLGNLITGFAGIIQAFMPMTNDMVGGLERLTAAFSRWGQGLRENASFQAFVDYVRSNVPRVMAFLGALAGAFVDLVQAAAPIGGVLLSVITNILQAFSRLQDAHPILATLLLAFVGLGAVALNLIGPILAIVNVVTLLAPLFSVLGTAIAAVATFIAGLGAGVLIAIGIIAALVVGLIVAYAKIEAFREVVNSAAQAVWEFAQRAGAAIMQGLQAAWQWLVSTFGPGVQAVIAYVIAEFQKIVTWAQQNAGTFAAAWENIKSAVTVAMQVIGAVIMIALQHIQNIWNAVWPGLSTVVQGAWTIISGVISAALNSIRALIQIFAGVIAGDWSAVWAGLGMLAQSAWINITSTVRGGWQIILGLFQMLGGQLRAGWDALWNLLPSPVQTALSFIATVIRTGWSVITTVFSVGVAVVRAVWSALWSVLSTVVSIAWSVVTTVVSAGWAVLTAVFTAGVTVLRTMWTVWWAVFGPPVRAAFAIVTAVISAAWAVIQALFSAGVAILRAVWSVWWTVFSTVARAALAVVVGVIRAQWAVMSAVFRAGAAALQAVWTAVWNMIRTIVTAVWNTIRPVVITGWNAIMTVLGPGLRALQMIFTTVWNAIRAVVTTVVNAIRNLITVWIGSMLSSVSNFASNLSSRWSSLWNNIGSTTSNMINRVRSTVTSGIAGVVSAITSGMSRAVGAVQAAAGRFAAAGANLMSSLARGITSKIGDAVGAVQGAVGKLTSLLPGSPAETGPLSGRGYALYRGQRLAEDLARGIRGETGTVERAARDLADLMTLRFNGAAAFDAIAAGVARPAVTSDAAQARPAITVQVAPGAVVIQVGAGVNLAQARAEFDGSAERLADELTMALRRR